MSERTTRTAAAFPGVAISSHRVKFYVPAVEGKREPYGLA